jgi:hypothetical protein
MQAERPGRNSYGLHAERAVLPQEDAAPRQLLARIVEEARQADFWRFTSP